MPRQALNFENTRKGRLFISHRVGLRGHAPLWAVRCDCGVEKQMSSTQLRGGTVSCGCQRRENIAKALTTHGMARKGGNRSRVYRIWNGVKQRCQNPNQTHYERYGGRGVTVCEEWQDFANFYADMGDPPSDKHTLDRIDNDKGYGPGNCRWATYLEQAHNKRWPTFAQEREAMSSDVMRSTPRELTDSDKREMQAVKEAGEKLHELIANLGDGRELSLAKTKVEEAVMWAVKHITR
jgi:hypothetical protein